jgi:hypothetical protein
MPGAANASYAIITMQAGDTILNHNRSRLRFKAGKAYTAGTLLAAQADTDSVRTWNVHILRTAATNKQGYPTINAAYAAAAAGDSILVFDAGLYPESLSITQSIGIVGYGIDYPGIDSLPVMQWSSGNNIMIYIAEACTMVSMKLFNSRAGGTTVDFNRAIDPARGVLFKKCVLDGNQTASTGIRTGSGNDFDMRVKVDSCTIRNYTGDGWNFFWTDQPCTLINSTIHNCNNTGVTIYEMSSFYMARNTIYRCASGSGVYLRDQSGDRARIVNNLIYNCRIGISEARIFEVEACQNNYFCFNTVVQCTVGGILLHTAGAVDTVMYNICWSNGNNDLDTINTWATCRAPAQGYNIYQSVSLNNRWKPNTADNRDTTLYPVFVDTTANNFRLQVGSPICAYTDFTADSAANHGVNRDVDNTVRPLPIGSFMDPGAYEENTSYGGAVRVDSAVYRCGGSQAVTNDTLILYFNCRLERDSLPRTTGTTYDSLFTVLGLGSMRGDSIKTPANADTSIVYVLCAGTDDTIFCHNRTRIALRANVVYDTFPTPRAALVDTDSVRTWNVHILSTAATNKRGYPTIHGAHDAAVAGDSVLVFDAGLYPETLTVSKNLTFMGYGIRYGTIDSLPVWQSTGERDTLLLTAAACTLVSLKFNMTSGTEAVTPKYEADQPLVIKKCVANGNNTCGIFCYPRGTNVPFNPWNAVFTVDSCTIYNFTSFALNASGTATAFSYNTIHYCNVGILEYRHDNLLIQNNTIYNCHNGIQARWHGSNWRIVGNLIYRCDYGLVCTNEPADDAGYIAFNTVAQCTTEGIHVRSNISFPDTVKYNICWGNGSADLDSTGGSGMPVSGYNYYKALSNWKEGYRDTTGAGMYPMFVDTVANNFRLQLTSPLCAYTNYTSDSATNHGLTRDIDYDTRPSPGGSTMDPGAFEELTSRGGTVHIDSVQYRSSGTPGLTDDTLFVYFNRRLERDSLPRTNGTTYDSLFTILGLGSIKGDTIKTPANRDTNIVWVLMAGTDDTILCHNRTRIALRSNVAYDTLSVTPNAAAADTDSVHAYNVAILRTRASYQTITAAYNAAAAGDSILIFDAGLYPETLSVARNTSFIGYGIDVAGAIDSLPVWQNLLSSDDTTLFIDVHSGQS